MPYEAKSLRLLQVNGEKAHFDAVERCLAELDLLEKPSNDEVVPPYALHEWLKSGAVRG
eukprot:SAG11_NODE_5924_length_1432_cov_1.188297_2_plen_59_part_00